MRVTLRKKRWDLVFRNMDRDSRHGYCDDPTTPGKKIVIDKKLTGAKRLSIIAHELIHALAWGLDEEVVVEMSEDVARVIHKLGYRCPEDQKEEKG